MQPAVLLAYSSTVANSLVRIAFAYGCAVSFWVQAVEGHMPVTNLHRHWEGASSFWGALSALTRRKAIRISLGKFYMVEWSGFHILCRRCQSLIFRRHEMDC